MGIELLGSSPAFAASMAECERALAEFVDWSLTDVLGDESALRGDEVVQPALFAVMVSLARLWQCHGVVPDAVVGHSQGEIAAAHIAGVLSLRDAVRAVVRRSTLCSSLAGTGLLLSVESAHDVEQRISGMPGVSVAAYNGPSSVVLAGDTASVTALAEEYQAEGVRARVIPVRYASHSVHVEPIRDRLLEELADIRPQPARIPWYSTVTGRVMAGPEADARYWYDNLRQPVRFAQAVETLASAGFSHFVEAGPRPVLAAAIHETVGESGLALATLRHDQGGADRFVTSLAEGYVRGLPSTGRACSTAAEPAISTCPPTPSSAAATGSTRRRGRPRPDSASGPSTTRCSRPSSSSPPTEPTAARCSPAGSRWPSTPGWPTTG
ncbi:acyltransferase domain-containing protein [Streptomyces sp. FXJ1.4098]|nr:acyltransferase domain-containing protein [Streptomyces sp. FXJ1.4098]